MSKPPLTDKEKKRLDLLKAASNALANSHHNEYVITPMMKLSNPRQPLLNIGFHCNLIHRKSHWKYMLSEFVSETAENPALSLAIVAYPEDEQQLALYIRSLPEYQAVSLNPQQLQKKIKEMPAFPPDIQVSVLFVQKQTNFGEQFWRIMVGKGRDLLTLQTTVLPLLLQAVLEVFLKSSEK